PHSLRNRCRDSNTLSAKRFAIGRVFNVASSDDLASGCSQRGANPEIRVGRVSIFHRSERSITQLIRPFLTLVGLAHCFTNAPRNDFPLPRNETPKHSATVEPRSEKVCRVPRSTGLTRGPITSNGLISRA